MTNVLSTTVAGRELKVEYGKVGMLSDCAMFVSYGDTVVLVNVNASAEPRQGIDFFPLSVEYEERLYAVGKIPGGFLKREGRPSEKAILNSRAIDRPIRPLFAKGYRNDSREHLLDHFDIVRRANQSLIQPIVIKRKSDRIDAEQMENRGVKVSNVDFVLNCA